MKKRRGLTLIEIVISMALIGIIALVFLSIFNTGNMNIFRAGKRTEDTYKLQQKIDEQIKNPTGFEGEPKADVNDKIVIVEIDGIGTISVEGKLIKVSYDDNKINSQKDNEIITFVPVIKKKD